MTDTSTSKMSYIARFSNALGSYFNESNLSCTHSLCGKFFLLTQNNNWINPLNAQIQQAKLNSIAELFEGNKFAEAVDNKEDVKFFFPKSVVYITAGIGKFGAGLLTIVVVSPVGVMVNGSLTLFYVARYAERKYGLLNKKDVDQANIEWNKASDYAIGLLLDATPILRAVKGGMFAGMSIAPISSVLIPVCMSVSELGKAAIKQISNENWTNYIIGMTAMESLVYLLQKDIDPLVFNYLGSVEVATLLTEQLTFSTTIKSFISSEFGEGVMRSAILRRELGLVNSDGFLAKVSSSENYEKFDAEILALIERSLLSLNAEFRKSPLSAEERKGITFDAKEWSVVAPNCQEKKILESLSKLKGLKTLSADIQKQCAMLECAMKIQSEILAFNGQCSLYALPLFLDEESFSPHGQEKFANNWDVLTKNPAIRKNSTVVFGSSDEQAIFTTFKDGVLAGKNPKDFLSDSELQGVYKLLSTMQESSMSEDEQREWISLFVLCGCLLQFSPNTEEANSFAIKITELLKGVENDLGDVLVANLTKAEIESIFFLDEDLMISEDLYFAKIAEIKEKFKAYVDIKKICEDWEVIAKAYQQVLLFTGSSFNFTIPACLEKDIIENIEKEMQLIRSSENVEYKNSELAQKMYNAFKSKVLQGKPPRTIAQEIADEQEFLYKKVDRAFHPDRYEAHFTSDDKEELAMLFALCKRGKGPVQRNLAFGGLLTDL